MSKRAFRTAAVALVLLTAVAVAQERTRDKKKATFADVYTSIQAHHEAGAYGKAIKASRELIGILGDKRKELLLAAMPAAPEGYEIVAQKKEEANPFANAMLMSVGNVVTQDYKGSGGNLRVTFTSDSPMVGMLGMMFKNPAMLGANAEMIKYEECNGILKKEGNAWNLQFLVEETLIEARFGSEDDDFALKMFDQAAVTRMHQAILN